MGAGFVPRAVACIALAGVVALAAGGAAAQKQGGSITVGLELDIPGLDPIKVGVYDTAAESAAALIFDTLTDTPCIASSSAAACSLPADPLHRHDDNPASSH